ncbi:MAG TPA: glycosyltransferase family 4 protein [Bacteroidota bacterium]
MIVVLTNATDIFAGGEDYVLILARYLARRGHTVHVSANPGHLLLEKCARAGIPTLPVAYTGMERVFAVGRELRRHLRRLSADVVHSNANYDRTAAALAAAFTGVRHVAGVHSSHSIQHNITHWLRNRYGIDHFVADAESVRSVLVRLDGIDPARISIIPIGVEPAPEAGRPALRAQARAELGASPETVVIGNLARLVPFKGHRVLLDAVARLAATRSDILVPIIGDGELLEELRRQAGALGIGRYVRFLGFRDDLDRLYAGFDVYCHSSLELAAEAFPLAILRALAAGLPVVCTDVGGIGLMVEDGRNGFLRPPDDPPALAEALGRVVADPPLRERMGRASRILFERNYHASAMAEAMEKVYERVRGS